MNRYFTFVIYFTVFTFSLSLAQKKWEGGISVGLANYLGDLVDSPTPRPEESQLTYGLYLRHRLTPHTGLRLQYLRGNLASHDANSADPAMQTRNFTFTATLSELSIGLDYELRGHLRFSKDGRITRNIWTPYFFAQGGMASVDPQTGWGSGDFSPEFKARIRADKEADYNVHHPQVGMGLGLRIDMDKRTTLNLEAGLRTAFTDYLDGISQAGNPQQPDWYSFTGLQLSMDIGPPDFDSDGVPDRLDECPQTRGPAQLNGCPDRDDDGIANIHDRCPNVAGRPEFAGCPDTDGDGLADPDDHCPEQAGTRMLFGCPDTDGDGIADPDDRCPMRAGTHQLAGCPDTDSDGLADVDDRCPEVAGIPEWQGCPPDTDGDGFADSDDQCPEVAGAETAQGCPDADGDGIADADDHCPEMAGSRSNMGCPTTSTLQQQEVQVLTMAIKAVRFQRGSAQLLPSSFAILDQIAEILKRNPDYLLIIHGFTDNTGGAQFNRKLSEARAQNCALYLTKKGIDPSRISWRGWGAKYPIADNDTKQGRQFNRRVEFELLLPGQHSKYP